MVYQWKSASRIKADANAAGAMFEHLEQTVGLTPQNLLDANRAEGTPLHNEFEWNDSVAAEAYRVTQAQYMIRMLCVQPETSEKPETPVRAYFRTTESNGYEHIGIILKSEDKHADLLRMAFRELDAFTRKYAALSELQPLYEVIETIRNEVHPE